MLTAAEFDRLPSLLRDIVVADRALTTVRAGIAGRIVSIETLRFARRKFRDRRELTVAADHAWGGGNRLGDGTART